MTQRLYYADAYRRRFEARVVDRADDGRLLYLDQSAFYPTSGGQPHDVGTLGGVAVADVIDEGDRVAHRLQTPLPLDAVDRVLEGVVDWPKRWDHMQQHTGQHLLSALCADRFGWATLSVHFGPESSTLDLSCERMTPAVQHELERMANAIVCENRSVTVSFEEARSAVGLRKASDRDGTLRIVSIDGTDRSACGGTHVRATGEIGAILLRRVEKAKQATRLEFLCGARAIPRARRDLDILARLAVRLSCSIDELATIIPMQCEQLRGAENDRRRLEEELNGVRARERYAATAPGEDGVRRVVDRRPDGKVDDSRALALAFCALPRTVYSAIIASPPAILIAASDDSGIDAGRVLKAALTAAGGRGGGSPRLAQGTVPDTAALLSVEQALGLTTAQTL